MGAPACRHNYADKHGNVRLGRAYAEGLWQSMCHPLHIAHMHVFATPSRIIVAACASYISHLHSFSLVPTPKASCAPARQPQKQMQMHTQSCKYSGSCARKCCVVV
jgi:hypothetical protein